MGCRVFDCHYEDVDSHCSLKSKLQILCQVYLYHSNNFFRQLVRFVVILRKRNLTLINNFSKNSEEKHDTNTFSERAVYDMFMIEEFILFPLG